MDPTAREFTGALGSPVRLRSDKLYAESLVGLALPADFSFALAGFCCDAILPTCTTPPRNTNFDVPILFSSLALMYPQVCAMSRKKKRLPRKTRAVQALRIAISFYCVGRISCEKPMVFTERNDGVLGGRQAGPNVKLVSKL